MLGLTLIAELSGIHSLITPCIDRTEDSMSHFYSRDAFPLNLCEDIGESAGEITSGKRIDVENCSLLAFDNVTRPECGGKLEKCLLEKKEACLDAAEFVDVDWTIKKLVADVSDTRIRSSAPIERQMPSGSVNVIDKIFEELV